MLNTCFNYIYIFPNFVQNLKYFNIKGLCWVYQISSVHAIGKVSVYSVQQNWVWLTWWWNLNSGTYVVFLYQNTFGSTWQDFTIEYLKISTWYHVLTRHHDISRKSDVICNVTGLTMSSQIHSRVIIGLDITWKLRSVWVEKLDLDIGHVIQIPRRAAGPSSALEIKLLLGGTSQEKVSFNS